MTLLARLLAGLVALFFLVWGLRCYFTPDAMAIEFGVAASGVAGLSTMRGDLGGAFVGIGALIAFGLRSGASRWLYGPAGIIGAVMLGRIVGFAADGLVPNSVVAFAVEAVFVAVLLGAARALGRVR